MGRVDDAMRRAAEAARMERNEAPPQAAPAEIDLASVSNEAFPVESHAPDRRDATPAVDVRPAAPVTPAAPVKTVAPAEPVVEARPAVQAIVADPAGEATLAATPVNGAAHDAGLADHLDVSVKEKVVVDENMMPSSREQYRRLAAALHHAQVANGVKVVMIASAVAEEGKTLTAANLALTLSESYRRNVLLVDADLRRPSLHTIFKVRGAPGLNEGLTSTDEPKLPLHDVSPRLTVLPAGMPNSDPMAGLTSRRMQGLIDEAREAFGWVIIDTPPVGLLTDANLLASMVDGAVLVIKAGSTPYDIVKKAIDTIGPAKVLGVVLNRADESMGRYAYNYNDYHSRATAPGTGGIR